MAATQRERSDIPASHRSIIPTVAGVPAGAAVLIAVACTFIGFFIDAGGSGEELTWIFALFYVVGCVAAALVVRYRGLFTTMVVPPLLLFISVPLAYQQLLGGGAGSVKDILLNLAIPLVNRFPTMAIATVLVLLVGGGRLLLYRQEMEGPGNGRPRLGSSRTSRPSDRTRRGRPTGPADTLRRRARSSSSAADDAQAPRANRRPPAGSGRTESSGRAQSSGRPQSSERAEPPGRTEPPGRKERPSRGAPPKKSVPPKKQPPKSGATKAVPKANYPRTSDRAAPAEPAPRRGRPPRKGDAPPHPRPNVRYRDRNPGRIER